MQLYYYLIPILSMGVGNLMGYAAAKRAFDLVVSVGAVFMLAPIWLGIGTILALTRHQIFFKQSRRGLDGKEFTVYKFVTMRPDSDGAPLEDDDPRVTRFGRILRKTALDELPEVWSIIKGDMSIVGPRALAIWEDSKCRVDFGKAWEQRYEVKPGLIGLAQLKCDRRDNFNKLYWDMAYIDHRSFWFDLKLFLQGSIGNVTGRWK